MNKFSISLAILLKSSFKSVDISKSYPRKQKGCFLNAVYKSTPPISDFFMNTGTVCSLYKKASGMSSRPTCVHQPAPYGQKHYVNVTRPT